MDKFTQEESIRLQSKLSPIIRPLLSKYGIEEVTSEVEYVIHLIEIEEQEVREREVKSGE